MTVAEIVKEYRKNWPKGHFFDRDSLAFFGEKYSEMSYCGVEDIEDDLGHKHSCHVLRSVQHDEYLGRRWNLSFFATDNFEVILPKYGTVIESGEWVSES